MQKGNASILLDKPVYVEATASVVGQKEGEGPLAEEFDIILRAIWDSPGLFFPFEYTDRGITKRATVYVGSIPSELHYMSNRNTIWKNVAFNLIER